jgi:hypothetical protein
VPRQLRGCPWVMDYDGPKLDKKPVPMSTVATLMTLTCTTAGTRRDSRVPNLVIE